MIRDTAPVANVGSFALVTAAGVTLEGARIAVVDAPGVSIAVTPNGYPTAPFVAALVNSGRVRPAVGDLLRRILPTNLDGGSAARLSDVYVRQGPTWRVGFDPDARTQPDLRASIGAYVAAGCSLDATRLSIDGVAGEYGVSNLGAAHIDGLRVAVGRRCSLAEAPGATSALTDASLPAPSRCSAAGLDLVRLPLSGE